MTALSELRGLVATCVGMGGVQPEFAECREELRAWNIQNGFLNVEYRTFACVLVEAGRDECAAWALQHDYDWVLQIDADATFPPETLARLLMRAYVDAPDSDAVGAYAQLKQPPFIPTIDTGTGTWESHLPGEGLLPVIRTGGHCLLTKTSAYKKMPQPWHRTRVAPRLLDVLREVDGASRQLFHGCNPFSVMPEWAALMVHAQKNMSRGPSSVGEDSGFCDNLMAVGGKIYVDTDLVTGHVAKRIINPQDHREAIEARERTLAAVCGLER